MRSRRKDHHLLQPGLHAFIAAARHGSFSAAAAELFLTHGAVSRRICALETVLDRKLFERGARGVTLTRAGSTFYGEVRAALGHLHAAVAALEAPPSNQTVTIGMSACVAARWFMPRMTSLQRELADTRITFHLERDVAGSESQEKDFSINYCDGPARGEFAELLMHEYLFPVYAATCARNPGAMDLSAYQLRQAADSDDWAEWLAATNAERFYGARTLLFDDYSLALEAAACGIGIAVGRSTLVEQDLASGRLARASERSVVGRRSYYLVHAGNRTLSARAQHAWNALLDLARTTHPPGECLTGKSAMAAAESDPAWRSDPCKPSD